MEIHGKMRVPSQKWQEFDALQLNILAHPILCLTHEQKNAKLGHGFFFEGLK